MLDLVLPVLVFGGILAGVFYSFTPDDRRADLGMTPAAKGTIGPLHETLIGKNNTGMQWWGEKIAARLREDK